MHVHTFCRDCMHACCLDCILAYVISSSHVLQERLMYAMYRYEEAGEKVGDSLQAAKQKILG